MNYDFGSLKRSLGRVIFALTLDKKRETERIVIGKSDEVRSYLVDGSGEVYYDETQPIGSWLYTLNGDSADEWNRHGMMLRESYAKPFPKESSRRDAVKPVSEFLQGKYKNGEPSSVFAAIRTWEDYLNCYNMDNASGLFIDRLSALYKPFEIYRDFYPWESEAIKATMHDAWRDSETSIELWYPIAKRPFEVAVVGSSLLPIVMYQLHKMTDWHFYYQRCKVCSAFFIAKNKRYELCSDKCRKVQATAAKREFNDRNKSDKLEQYDNADYNYWYNQLRKLNKAGDIEAVKTFKAALTTHRREALKRKTAIKNGIIPLSDYTSWLISQQREADLLLNTLQKVE